MDGDGVTNGGLIVLSWKAVGHILRTQDSLTVKEGWVYSVAFSADGRAIAAGCTGNDFIGRVVLWDAATRKRLMEEPLAVEEGVVLSVAFSPDGKKIAAGYGIEGFRTVGDERVLGGVVVWDVASRARLTEVPLPMYEGDGLSLAFSPDGKTIAAGYGGGGIGGGVMLWDVDPKSWQRKAGQIANRNFMRDEWRQYFHDEPYRPTFPDLPVPPAGHSQHAQGRR